MFDEETGMPERDRAGKHVPRTGRTPCEIKAHRLALRPDADPDDGGVGCPKGHWKDNPDPSPAVRSVIHLYEIQRASCGACLTDAERRDRFLAEAFQQLYTIDCQWAEARARTSEQYLARIASS